jgi:hypothetical protein
MAENKKSFIAYSDWHGMFKALPDEIAGKLIKHTFSYVNDENPSTDDFIINALFEQIKATLKRDLVKWDLQREQRSLAGKRSAEIRLTKSNERSTEVNETQRKPTVSVNVNDNVNDNVNVKDKVSNSLMSEIEISDVPQNEIDYFNVANAFFQLFQQNAIDLDVRWVHLDKLTYKRCVTPIRLLATNDNRTRDEMLLVFDLLKKDLFWKQNIQSTEKLREKFDQLITKAQNYGKSEKRVTSEPYDLSCFDD